MGVQDFKEECSRPSTESNRTNSRDLIAVARELGFDSTTWI